MNLDIYYIDAFISESYKGNTACVIPLNNWFSDQLLLQISKKNSVPETAFIIIKKNKILLRWFTPDIEMDLCGHATLAAAHCIINELKYNYDKIIFETLSGKIEVIVKDNLYKLSFPSRNPIKTRLPEIIKNSLSIQPKFVLKSRDYILVYEKESDVQNIVIDQQIFDKINLDPGGVCVTSVGDNYDFVSRFFTPQSSILEDPVTGSSHCSLVPYWSNILKKNTFKAIQISKRGGLLMCESKGNRVIIGGKANTFFKETLSLNSIL
jgi:PhzF family phenazine biosynthesis protein